MKEITECIGDIGRANSSTFMMFNLTSWFWQMKLDEEFQKLTAFTIHDKWQFHWITSPMGLLSCQASFQRLMEGVLRDIQNILVYINGLLVHTNTHEKHLQVLNIVLARLHKNHLTINLEKWGFSNKEVFYLGFTLTLEGIKPRKKLNAIIDAKTPTDIKTIWSFVGLCNFFSDTYQRLHPDCSPACQTHKEGFRMQNRTLTRRCKSGFPHTPKASDIKTSNSLS